MKIADRVFRRTDWTLNSPFGPRKNPFDGKQEDHNGTDYGTGRQKWPQFALEDGTVTAAGTDQYGALYCWVRYPRLGVEAQHLHLDKMFVKKGQNVTKDTVIGNTGTTGRSTGVHLHLALRKSGAAARMDPHAYDYSPPGALNPQPTKAAAKSIDDLAREVIRGDWGNGEERRKKLSAAGYDYAEIQPRVNEMLKKSEK